MVAVAATPSVAGAATTYGVSIMDGAIEVAPGRFQMTKDWDHVIQFYRQVYGPRTGYAWTKLAETPKVKAIHVENLKRGSKWEGLNIYETSKGVFVYVVPAPESELASGAKKK